MKHRYISEKHSRQNGGPEYWNIYRYSGDDKRGPLVAKVFDKETHDILMQAPAEIILAKLLTRADKKHYHAKNASTLDRFQAAFVGFLRKL